MEKGNVQTEMKPEVDHLDILNAFHDDPSELIDYCVNLAEKGMEKERDFLKSLEEKNVISDPTGPAGMALADLSLSYLSAGFTAGLLFRKKFKIEDERLAGFLTKVEKGLKDRGALPEFDRV